MSKREIRICNGCGKEIPMMRITFKDYSENGYQMGESCIPFGVSDICDHSYDLCLDCLDKARKNNFVLSRVKCGDKIEPLSKRTERKIKKFMKLKKLAEGK